jgi:hypothetical protein
VKLVVDKTIYITFRQLGTSCTFMSTQHTLAELRRMVFVAVLFAESIVEISPVYQRKESHGTGRCRFL